MDFGLSGRPAVETDSRIDRFLAIVGTEKIGYTKAGRSINLYKFVLVNMTKNATTCIVSSRRLLFQDEADTMHPNYGAAWGAQTAFCSSARRNSLRQLGQRRVG